MAGVHCHVDPGCGNLQITVQQLCVGVEFDTGRDLSELKVGPW